MIKPECEHCTPPEPPPMRIGDQGDTIDRHGVRRKADGSLRTWHPETVLNWIAGTTIVGAVVGLAVLVIANA